MEWYSIAEFAEKAGASKQAIYKRIKTESFKKFLRYEGKKTFISSDALEQVRNYQKNQLFNPDEPGEKEEVEKFNESQAEIPEEPGEIKEEKQGLKVEKESLKVENPGLKVEKETAEKTGESSENALIKQLQKKDEQIAFLQEQLAEAQAMNRKKDEYILKQGEQLSNLLEQAHILNKNNQVLLGMRATTTEPAEADPANAEPVEVAPAKKSLFQRLFRR